MTSKSRVVYVLHNMLFKRKTFYFIIFTQHICNKTIITLVEASHDNVWGTGIPLSDINCLNRKHWKNIGILGEILMDIRKESLHSPSNIMSPNSKDPSITQDMTNPNLKVSRLNQDMTDQNA